MNILQINSSARRADANSTRLASLIAGRLLGRHPDEARRSGLLGSDAAGDGGADDARIEQAVAARAAAKKARDFAEADRIRAELLSRGIVLEDGPAGTTWRRA